MPPPRAHRQGSGRPGGVSAALIAALALFALLGVQGCARQGAGVEPAAEPRVDHGVIRTRGHHFVFADGAPFIALGENRINIYDRTWNYAQLSAPEYVKYMAENGMTVLRVFIVTDVEDEEHGGAPPPGCLEPKLGEFSEKVARDFDAIFRAAEEHGVYVVLVAFALGFSEDDPWKSWEDNPYAAARGGPAKTRYDFFSDPEAMKLEARRLRYLAKRYGASTHLLAIDLINEPEWDGAIPEVLWTPWAEEMARIWREADPKGHLVTAGSVGLHWNIEGDDRAWYASPENDIVQWHLYGKETYEVHALSKELNRKVRETWEYDKPVLIGEFAYGGEPKPDYDHTHVGLWTAIFSGAWPLAHSAPPFNIDSDELMTPERARHFRVLRRFLEGLPPMSPEPPTVREGVTTYELRGENTAALWLLAPEEGYGSELAGATVELKNLRPGHWRITWVDDLTGEPVHASEEDVKEEGTTRVRSPAFSRHVAVKVERIPSVE